MSIELPKSAFWNCVVPIPDALVTVMQQIKKEQAKRKLMMGGAYKDNDLIVYRNDDSFYNPNGFTCSWRKATRQFVKYKKENKTFLKKHGLSYPNFEYLTHHAMRSTLATFYISCGMSDVSSWDIR